VITDSENDAIRFVPATSGTYFGQAMTAGDIYTIAGCQRSSNPAVFLSAVQVIQHPDVQVIPHFRGRGSTTWAP
jgi:hypothetical protein